MVAVAQRSSTPLQDPRNKSFYGDDDMVSVHVEDARPLTWHKDLYASSLLQTDVPALPATPRPLQPRKPRRISLTPLQLKRRGTHTTMPVLFFWFSIVSVVVLLLGGIFGVFITYGHGLFSSSVGPHGPTLQASSTDIAIGATLTLRGTNFSPHGRVGLSHDAIITIVDTGGTSVIQADAHGDFIDTVTVAPDWQAGIHSINAEDAHLHKIARLSLIVTGQSTSLRPAHLLLSASVLDLGTGDLATNSTKTLTLSNVGGGQITWQGNTDKPWLLITPRQGTFASGTKATVTVAVNRSTLVPGVYTTHVDFLSNAGDTKVTITMRVVPLDPAGSAVLQVSPAVLTFTATDGGARPPTQTITISDPGVRPLQWSATTNAPWLSLSPSIGTVQNAATADTVSPSLARGTNSQTASVSIDTSTLLPGTYSGAITISGQATEQVKDSPQSIVVTITITPQCGVVVAPSLLTFASVYQQSAPASKSLSVDTSQGCNTPVRWSATTAAQWLTLNTTSGTTSTKLAVGINTAGLSPATYKGSIVFTSSSGTETVPVTFTLCEQATPVMNVSTTTLTYTSVVGNASIDAQNIGITNTAGGTLNWQATAATSVGGNWLSVTPVGGSLTAQQTATLTVTVAQTALTPNTYTGTITLVGTDGAGHAAPGSPMVIPVSLVVQAACVISIDRAELTFTGIAGQPNPTSQDIIISASGACTHMLTWTATPNANWLITTPATGAVALGAVGKGSVGVTLAGLSATNYQAAITITARDSVTQAAIGVPIAVAIALTVQSACTISAPSSRAETFTTEAGLNPDVQTFTLAVSGTCNGNVTITPASSLLAGSGWLTVKPASVSVATGRTATFTVSIAGTALTAGTYNGSILLAATVGGAASAGSPQTVGVTVNVTAPATMAASAGGLSTNTTGGVTTQPVNIANTGGTAMNWTATLTNAPAFVSLTPTSGTLGAGMSTTTNIFVSGTGVTGTYTAAVTLTATDVGSGSIVAGSPISIPVTIIIASPTLQASASSLTFAATAGTNPAAQTVMITNIGGGTLNWTASIPSAGWLTLDSTGGSDTPNVSSTLTCSVNTARLAAGPYTATIVLTPSAGATVIITVTLTVVAVVPTPTVGVTPVVGTTPTVGITPTPTIGATSTATV